MDKETHRKYCKDKLTIRLVQLNLNDVAYIDVALIQSQNHNIAKFSAIINGLVTKLNIDLHRLIHRAER